MPKYIAYFLICCWSQHCYTMKKATSSTPSIKTLWEQLRTTEDLIKTSDGELKTVLKKPASLFRDDKLFYLAKKIGDQNTTVAKMRKQAEAAVYALELKERQAVDAKCTELFLDEMTVVLKVLDSVHYWRLFEARLKIASLFSFR